jgi:hypothetical protein
MTRYIALTAVLVVLSACSPEAATAPRGLSETTSFAPTTVTTTTTTRPPTTTTTTTRPPTTTTTMARYPAMGTVTDPTGRPLPGTTVAIGATIDVTDDNGEFFFDAVPAEAIAVARPGWLPASVDWQEGGVFDIVLEPRVVRALRASKSVAADDARFGDLLDHAAATAVNALVFDTKDESGFVLYDSRVPQVVELDSAQPRYDPVARLAEAHEAGLYTITRIVTFEDAVWTERDAGVKLAGRWVDARDEEHWEYPLALAVEACELGFDEIQFDYVRFPAGRTAAVARSTNPTTEEERVATIAAFLSEARSRLNPLGCAMSADVFAIVFSAGNDQGIGQRPEDLSPMLDAISPMIYPSHYSDGWLGFAEPNDHPAAVTARALDDGGPRVAHPALIRPWLQAFSYTAEQVLAGIAEAEARGHGWMLWNASGEYDRSWLPLPDSG